MPDAERQQDFRPVPDPTQLTTDSTNRLEGMLRTLIQTETQHQADLSVARIAVIEIEFRTQLRMLDARTAEQKKDTKDALDAALAAQKEAVAAQTTSSEKSIIKSETATIERIRALETLLTASTKSTDDKFDDLKSRVVAIEATKLGMSEQVTDTRASNNDIRAWIASGISIIAVLIAIVSTTIAILKP